MKLLKKTPSLKLTLADFVTCTNRQTNYWTIYCLNCTGGNIYLLYNRPVHSCFEVSCMIAGLYRETTRCKYFRSLL